MKIELRRVAALSTSVLLIGFFFGDAWPVRAQVTEVQSGPRLSQTTEFAPSLPLRQVVLFSSGVAYYERAGRVAGSGIFDLMFRPQEINDVLKSLVLFDPLGEVRPVTYSIADYVANRPRSTDLTIDSAGTLGALLQGFQGSLVRLETNDGAVEGRIISVSSKTIRTRDGDSITVEVATALTEAGLRVLSLDNVTSVKLLDARLDAKLRESLNKRATAIVAAVDNDRRAVRLQFAGRAEREVRAGYLQESPVWKTSYRLVLDDKGKTLLQGWAVVENTTDEDWNDIRLSLVSGRPVSFTQNLYQPLYIFRPEVAPQVMGVPKSQVYSETVSADGSRATALEARPAARAMTPNLSSRSGGVFMNSGQFGAADEARRRDIAASAEQLAQSVASQAQGSERGELFEYSMKTPVSIPRSSAALVPIVSDAIEAEKLSIFDAGDSADRAVYGVRLKNTTGLHLSGGPVTVFQAGIYAGDAQINNVQPGESRLLSYAVDLDLVISRRAPRTDASLVSLTAKSGVLNISRKQRRERLYGFRNKSANAKTLIVQQPKEIGWTLVQPEKASEESPNEYRFRVGVAARGTASLPVIFEMVTSETIALLDLDLNALVAYARGTQVSATLRAALENIVARRRKIIELQRQRTTLEDELKAIDAEQTRIRSNMGQLDRNSELYKQYVQKLTAQETRIERIRGEAARLRDSENAARSELQTYLDGLTVQ